MPDTAHKPDILHRTVPLEMKHGRTAVEPTPDALRIAGNRDPGKFGRMFDLPPLVASDAALLDLARAMKDAAPSDPAQDNPNVPAGYTYLGQFIDHDITLDLTPLAEQTEATGGTTNFRSPGLDLDALYGPGAALSPYMYERLPPRGKAGPKLLLGTATASPTASGRLVPDLPNDLPRNSAGRAIIGDERNDENLLVAQTHLAFMKFHNRVVDHVRAENPAMSDDAVFAEARRLATWHYQWIVLFDFVERLTEPGLIRKIKNEGRKFYRFKSRPFMPVEFSAAAFRLGHSMVREDYDHNAVFNPHAGSPDRITDGTLNLLFNFTGKSGGILGSLAGTPGFGPFAGPSGPTLPSNWVIDWRRFYDFATPPAPFFGLNHARRLDPFIIPALHTLPGEADEMSRNLAFRNLKRGVLKQLPSGQAIAKKMKVRVLTPAEIATGPDGAAAAAHGLHEATPLWYYILKEAEVIHQGLRLGPVGSTIVAEVFLGLVHGDTSSFLFQERNWKPTLPRANPDTFTMVDLLNFVGDLNPVG
jgi:hypothetical protein